MSYAGPDWREQLDASRARYERPQVKSEQSDQDEWRHFGGRATVRPARPRGSGPPLPRRRRKRLIRYGIALAR